MIIELNFNNETFIIDLNKELKISEERINEELLKQPTHFAFLSMLQAKFKRELSMANAKLERTRAELFIEYKRSPDPETGRPYSNDLAEANVLLEDDFKIQQKKVLDAEEKYGIIKTAVDAFNQRKDLIQSLSANLRREK